ncbi:MAG: glucosaminidase domain-containing protein [Alphaproteobacteria bacterium]|nr:glucosaminidase domain-containing protein [Alphaproteobacteria bacterium]
MIKRLVFCFFLFFSLMVKAQDLRINNTGAYFSDYTSDNLSKAFKELDYETYILPQANAYPRLFVKNLPSDLALMEDKTFRNRLFMQILIPLILKANEEVLQEREIVEALEYDFEQNKDFDEADMYYLDELAQKYDVSSKFKDTRRYLKLFAELKQKVDIVPPSILLAAAAIYTDWGTSRVAQLANNLYQTKMWFSNEGLEPSGGKEEGFTYKIYDSLEDCISDYVLKINSNINYQTFRQSRTQARKKGDILYGKRFDWTMILDSNLPNFAGLLDYTLTYYKLHHVDEATLENEYDLGEN